MPGVEHPTTTQPTGTERQTFDPFTCLESEGAVNYIRAVPTEEVEVGQTESTFKDYECDPDFYELCSILMEERALTESSNHVEALISIVSNIAQHDAVTPWNLKAVRLISNPGELVPVPVKFSLFHIHEYTK